ncbi:MAG: hypothetical protein OXI76_09835 [Gemmatimonadota bacterium]|nr:hypothetical protein [Gemmatimonadota bacterium]
MNAERAQRGLAPLSFSAVSLLVAASLAYSVSFLGRAFLVMRRRDL